MILKGLCVGPKGWRSWGGDRTAPWAGSDSGLPLPVDYTLALPWFITGAGRLSRGQQSRPLVRM